MSNEAAVWAGLKQTLGDNAQYLERIEATMPLGVPDVHYVIEGVAGWIELKDVPRPKKRTTPVRIRHFTKMQRNWLVRYGKAQGCAWVLVHVDGTHYLFDWRYSLILGDLHVDQMMEHCAGFWDEFIPRSMISANLMNTLCTHVYADEAFGQLYFKI